MSNQLCRSIGVALACLAWGVGTAASRLDAADTPTLETKFLQLRVSPETGGYEIRDKRSTVVWKSNPFQPRFGEVTFTGDGKTHRADLTACEVRRAGDGLRLTFRLATEPANATFRVDVRPAVGGQALEFAFDAGAAPGLDSVRLLDEALWTTDAEHGYVVVPVREGLLIPADSKLAFTHRFDTFAYEGCHLEMLGVVKSGAAALITWHDPYVAADVRSTVTNSGSFAGGQALSTSLVLRKSARSFRVQFLGLGDYGDIAAAYRQVAKEKGWLVTWDEKLRGHPERAKYFGASNVKLWSTLSRTMSEDSRQEQSVRVNWTFAEAAQVAEHLKRDLQLDRVLFTMGGWIHRGYDNQHPDILPTPPECGGDAAFADCCQRVRALGYLLCLHDNYQDIYRDSPSWNEDFISKNPDGSLVKGGHWAGGLAYITCSQKAVELAQRPQNLPAVKQLSDANSYFIDTTYAAGLMECFDQNHPLTRSDDMQWKQALSDYARGVFGSFGSECGREWAIPHADFFEGLTGVSGTYYHNKDLPRQLGATVLPLFEMVFHDCIAAYGKYGYDPMQSAEYVLHHLTIGRPLNYHSIPAHLYWKEPAWDGRPLPLRPAVADFKPAAPRQFSITYRWTVSGPVPFNWPIFVHFTDAQGKILFQNDHEAQPAMTEWKPGEVLLGPYQVTVPAGLEGTFDLRIGMFNRQATGSRPALLGEADGEHRYLLGKLKVTGDAVEFLSPAPAGAAEPKADPGLFCRADGGWAAGLHHMDRFLKNTHEILSPLNELTARMRLTRFEFLTPDRLVRRSVFGEDAASVEVIVNASSRQYRHRSSLGGEVVLPAYGFVVESPTFVAFHAQSWNGLRYEAPTLFTLRSMDDRPLSRSARIRVFHAFGDERLKLGENVESVVREAVIKPAAR